MTMFSMVIVFDWHNKMHTFISKPGSLQNLPGNPLGLGQKRLRRCNEDFMIQAICEAGGPGQLYHSWSW